MSYILKLAKEYVSLKRTLISGEETLALAREVIRLSAVPESGAQYKQLEALIVEVIRRCGVKGGVAPETYGAMCEGVREILRLAGPDAP